jgi:hypothetical protein
VQRDSLRGGGAGLHLRAHRQHSCLPGQGALDPGDQGWVPPVPFVASEEEEVTHTPSRTTCNKLGRGSHGHGGRVSPFLSVDSKEEVTQVWTSRQDSLLQKTLEGEPRAQGRPPKTAATRGQGSHSTQERGLSISSSSSSLEGSSDLAHQRVIENLNLKLEVARANANKKTTANVLYANVIKGPQSFPTPPPPPPPTSTPPPPGAQPPLGKDDKLAILLRGIMAYISKRQL